VTAPRNTRQCGSSQRCAAAHSGTDFDKTSPCSRLQRTDSGYECTAVLTDRPGPRARVDVQRDQSSTEDAHTHTCKCTHTCMRARTNTLGAPTAPTGSKPLLRRLKGTPLVLQPLADEGAQPPTKRASSHHALQKTCRSQVQLDRNAGIRRGREAEIDTVQRGKGGGAGAASAPHGGAAMETASSYDPSTTGFNSSTPTTGHGSTSVSGMGSEV
jgi:hypothetical protein